MSRPLVGSLGRAVMGSAGSVRGRRPTRVSRRRGVPQEGEGSDPEPPDAAEDSKSENGENAPIYCICRKPDINCFMM